jgi:uncharacterized membrane protein YeiH
MTLTGCQSLKDASVVGTTAAVGATAGVAMSGGLLAPAVGAMIGGVTGSITSDLMTKPPSHDLHRESIFLLAEKVVRVAGWWLVLLFIAPWLLGWAIPGPMKFKKLNGKGHE